jgi:tRNA A-37 threonylcarbamoyl transferase component Bud32
MFSSDSGTLSHRGREIKKAMKIGLDGIHWRYFSEKAGSWPAIAGQPSVTGEPRKSSYNRCVLRLPQGIFIKQIRYWGMKSGLKTLWKGNAYKEWKMILELERRGVPVPEVLAFGTDRSKGLLKREILVTKEISKGISLADFIKNNYPRLDFREKLQFIESFALFIKHLHEAGIFHADLHLRNIFIHRNNGENSFVLLDLDRVRINPVQLSQRQRTANLALLLANFWTLGSLTERFRFLKCYNSQWRGTEGRNFIKNISRIAFKISHKNWRKKTKRCLSNNSRFVKEKVGAFKIYRARCPVTDQILRGLLPDPDHILEQGEILKNGKTVKAAKIELDGRLFFLKRYNCKGWKYQIRNSFRRSRALRTWRVTWGFAIRDLPVPKPLICLEERNFRLLRRSFVLSEFLEKTRRINDLWGEMNNFDQTGFSVRLAMILGRMHRVGGFHGDLKWNNILVRPFKDGKRIVLCDMDSARVYRHTQYSKSIKDLQRFLYDRRKWDADLQNEAFFISIWKKWSGISQVRSD